MHLADRVIERGVPCIVFSLTRPWNSLINLRLRDGRVSGFVSGEGSKFRLSDISACLGPFLDFNPKFPGMLKNDRLFAAEEWYSTLYSFYLITRDKLWVNPLETYLLGECKFLQMQEASKVGLSTPDSLITTDFQAMRDFSHSYPEGVALKRVGHAPRAMLRPRAKRVIYTSRLRASDLSGRPTEYARFCPTHLERYVDKSTELRVYVLRDKVFAAEILSQEEDKTRDDWRRYPTRKQGDATVIDKEKMKMRTFQMPEDISSRCRRLAERLGMVYAAMDFIKTPSGEFVFLEANSSGAYLYIEERLGLPITEALVDILISKEPEANPTPMANGG
jgi:hypothetical protein